MNLTTTHAAQTACAEPGLALRTLYRQPTPASERKQRAVQHRSPANDAQQLPSPAATESERLGLILLGIGYDTSVA